MPAARIAKTEKSQFSAQKYAKSPETPRKIAKKYTERRPRQIAKAANAHFRRA